MAKIPSEDDLHEIAVSFGDEVLSSLPQIKETGAVSLKIDLLTGEITPKEVSTDSLIAVVKEASEELFDKLKESFDISKDAVKVLGLEIKGKEAGGYEMSLDFELKEGNSGK